ncbi:MAG: hypothetical protein PHV68_10270, partial [Candidatus Gastranaerophilales bacterium]|nr:hypothetical protein [Candidatus Gastranaerophilales bacterium]
NLRLLSGEQILKNRQARFWLGANRFDCRLQFVGSLHYSINQKNISLFNYSRKKIFHKTKPAGTKNCGFSL